MCATNLWTINAAAYTAVFERFTEDRLGIAPLESATRISSARVRGTSVVFTLTRRMCDCDTLIGRRDGSNAQGEIEAEAWLGWLRELPDHVPHVARIAVLRAWSPGGDAVIASTARGIRIGELSEDTLRGIRDNALLTIDYPRVI